ncbi:MULTISPECIES: NADH:flavin oxidoreductase [Sphingobium]|uniref:NADH:flavin oxidoreductase n=1 Tax=Sphingobium sp. MI1205 TaxID=407020 RepID=UPI0007703BAC|nr:NADH:flavin oxidoreductase [Sphingobium sp. MI1205]AMK16573.1 NADH:flavin oxidoreductase [Sphingobium sp. MI1205]
MENKSLFTPFQSQSLSLRNRLVMAPMTRTFSPSGVPTADVAAYYKRRAEGGVGLIITEGSWIPHSGASNEENAPRFYGEDALAGWATVVREVHDAGAQIVPQLWHVGLTHRPKAPGVYEDIQEDFSTRVSPSGYVAVGDKIAEGMSDKDVEDLIEAYATAAATAKALGFDGVEIHGAHGYMVDQFLWAETNKRTDRWGGDIAGRTRFAVEMARACRAAVGPDFAIILRFSQWKLQDYGAKLATTPQELEQFLLPLADAGIDIFHASQRRFWEPEFAGSDLSLAGWAKKITGKPSITVGSVGLDRELLETSPDPTIIAHVAKLDQLFKMHEQGDFDLVAVGRALIADPDWPLKVQAGRFDDLQPFDVGLLATLT